MPDRGGQEGLREQRRTYHGRQRSRFEGQNSRERDCIDKEEVHGMRTRVMSLFTINVN